MSATNSCACFTSLLLPVSFFYAVVCWGGSIKKRDAGRLDRLVRKAGAVVGTELDCLTTVAERRTPSRLLTILDNVHHPLYSTVNRQKSIFSGRLLSLSCSSDRLRKSFVPRAIQLHNGTQKGEGEGDGLLCMSLPQSALPFSSHLIIFHPTVHPFTGYTSPLHRLYYLYLFAHTTSTRTVSLCSMLHTST